MWVFSLSNAMQNITLYTQGIDVDEKCINFELLMHESLWLPCHVCLWHY